MKKRQIEINLNEFPPELHGLLRGSAVYDSSSSSSARVLYCGAGYYIKIDETGMLAEEAALAREFFRRGLGVEVVDYISGEKDYLVTAAAPGGDLTQLRDRPRQVCEILGQALGTLHRQDVRGFPVSLRLRRYLESAGGAQDGGCYDESVLMERFKIDSKNQAWQIMQERKNDLRADTLIHGDACLPNVIAEDGRFRCFVDLPLAGVGDRHIDLYWAAWSLQYNFKTDRYTDYFFDVYGRENFDMDLLKAIAAFELFG